MIWSRSDIRDVSRLPDWKDFVNDWGPAVFWAGMIFLFSTDRFSSSNTSGFFDPWVRTIFSRVTPEQLALMDLILRKAAHLTEYFIFSLLLIRALNRGSKPKLERRHAAWVLAAVLLYALSDEFHQVFVPSRTPSLADVGIDWSAGVCGILWTYLFPLGKTSPRRRTPPVQAVAVPVKKLDKPPSNRDHRGL